MRSVWTLALGLSLTFAGAAPAQDWTQFRGDPQLTGRAQGSLPADPKVLWTHPLGEGVEATAAIAGDRIYLGGLDGGFYALDLATGKPQWKYQAEGSIRSSPALADGVLFFGDEAGFVHAVAADTGTRIWRYEALGEVTSSPNLAGDCVLVGSFDQFLYCLSPKDGTVRWKVETDGPVNASPAVFRDESFGDLVLSSGCDGYLRSLKLSDGTEVHKIALGGYVAASAAVGGSRAFVGTFENKVLAVDLGQSEVVWRYEHPSRKFPFYASAALAGDLVIAAGRDKMVHGLDGATGEARWTFPTRGRIDASPVVLPDPKLGSRVFVGGESGVLYALKVASGEEVWRFETGSSLGASPAIGQNRLVISSMDGAVYCFGTPPAAQSPEAAARKGAS